MGAPIKASLECWTATIGDERPPDGSRCAVARIDEDGNDQFDLSIYLGVPDQWDDSTQVGEYLFRPFTHYELFYPLPELP